MKLWFVCPRELQPRDGGYADVNGNAYTPDTANTEVDAESVWEIESPSYTPSPPNNQLGMPEYEEYVSSLISGISL